MDKKIKIIKVKSEQELKNNVCTNLKEKFIANITRKVGLFLTDFKKNPNRINETLENIIEKYLFLYQIVNIDSNKDLESSFKLNNKILISRIESKSNKVQENETIDKLLLNIVVSLASVNNNNEKLSIKSVSKIINYLYNDLNPREIEKNIQSKMDLIYEGLQKEIKFEKEMIKGDIYSKIYKENHKYLGLINKERNKTTTIINDKIKNLEIEKSNLKKAIKTDKTQKTLKNLLNFLNLKQVLKLEDIEKIKNIDKLYLEKNLNNEELYELFKDEKYKKNIDNIKTKYKEIFKQIENKNENDMTEKEKIYLNNKKISNNVMFEIFEYILRNEEKQINKDYLFKILTSSKDSDLNIIILIEDYINFIKDKMKFNQNFSLNKFFKLESKQSENQEMTI